MTESQCGQVVTFYSYKGGTGRTMALANVAWILAAAGKRVLVADWDLESPGLHRYFKPFLKVDDIASTGGVIDLIQEFEDVAARQNPDMPGDWVSQLARVQKFAFSLSWEFPNGGCLDFLSAGRQNGSYAAVLSGLDWENFFERGQGKSFLYALRQDMINRYDYSLIDSRTGFSDVSDICTGHLPDTLIDCFTLSNQGITGAAELAAKVQNHKVRDKPGRNIRVFPVAMRVDPFENDKAAAGRALALRSFPGLPTGLTESERVQYFRQVEVPYRTYFAYEETLATFGEPPGLAGSVLSSYEQITKVITNGEIDRFVPMEETVRNRWKRQFERSLEESAATLVLEYAPEDQVWAEWITSILSSAQVSVVDQGPVGLARSESNGPEENRTKTSRTLVVISGKYAELRRETPREVQELSDSPPLCVHIDDVNWPMDAEARVHISDLSAPAAAEQILRLVGEVPAPRDGDQVGTVRYPGTEPDWFQAPIRNPRFTGRMEDLYRLRSELRSRRQAVVLPIALQGMGGIGKTQLALEYVHRFRNSYDLVWWIQADPPQFIDTALTDLAIRIGLPAERTAVESALAALAALKEGTVAPRWLVVFDNADDLEQVEPFLPETNRGHLLLTSRNAEWSNRAQAIPVDVFRRNESVAHLRGRVPSMSREQAERLADVLADLPIATAIAGAWLAETGTPVEDYLRVIEREGAGALSLEAVWDLSLDRLNERSPAAYRLLQICSVLAPETALGLLYSDEMAAHLMPYDPSVSDRLMRGTLIQQINRLALVKLDVQAGQAQVHRLLQEVVRRRMSQDQIEAAQHEAHLVLAKYRPEGEVEDPATWPRFRMLWPHLEISGASRCYDESVRQLLIDRVRYLWRRGDYDQGMQFGTEVAGAWDRLLQEESVPNHVLRRQLLVLRFNIANILREVGRFEEALKLDEEILFEQRELLGSRHTHTLMTTGGRNADLRALGRYAETVPLDREAFGIWKDVLGENHPRTLSAANNLATSLRSMGQFREAMEIDADVWQRRRTVLGALHPLTLHSASSLGRDYREAGDYDKSVNLLRGLLHEVTEELSAETAVTLNIQVNLAASLRAIGRAKEAEPLLQQAFDAFRVRFARDNPFALACRQNRAANLLATGNTTLALREMETVTGDYISTLSEDHPFTLVCFSNQSAAHRAKEEDAAAYELIRGPAAKCRELLGDSHPYSLATAMNLAICEYEAGEGQLGLNRAEALVKLMRQAMGQSHPDTLACVVNQEVMAEALEPRDPRGLGRGAQPSDSPAFKELARLLGSDHPTVRDLRAGVLVYRVIDPHDPF